MQAGGVGQVETALALLDGVLAKLPGADRRDGQREMVRRIALALHDDEHLLVQAGTGTGKSLAYLVAAVAWRRRVLVTTATKALQSQLLDADLPRVAAALREQTGRELTSAVAKGRANYLCLERLHGGDDQLELDPGGGGGAGPRSRRERQVTQLRAWAQTTDTGDRDDLDSAVDDAAWRAVSVDGRDCLGSRCPFREDCFAERARAAAADADVVVANHALLAVDLVSPGSVLPERDLVVLDEAHDVEQFVTQALTAELSATGTARALRLATPLLPAARVTMLGDVLARVEALLTDLPAGLLPQLPATVRTVVAELARAAEAAAGELEPSGEEGEAPEARDHRARAALRELADTATALLEAGRSDAVYAARDADATHARLRVSPLVVATQLHDRLLAGGPVVATSATLLVDGTVDHIAHALGFTESGPAEPVEGAAAGGDAGSCPDEERTSRTWSSFDAGSPFDYPRQAQLYVAAQLPDPARAAAAWEAAVDAELVDLIRAAGGRTLALFSSTRAARRAAAYVRGALDLPILLQGEDTPARLQWQFAREARACLFGTRGLWQGLDVVGSSCQLVVIDRIPFPSPEEPLAKARTARAEEAGRSGFATVAVPAAAVPLAQGVGRLIRSASDRGVIAVLDPRLVTKGYGARLRRSLPPAWLTTDRAQVLRSLAAIDVDAPPVRPVGAQPAQARRERVRIGSPAPTVGPAPPAAAGTPGWSQNELVLLRAGIRAGRTVEQLAERHEMGVDELRTFLRAQGIEAAP